MIQIERLQTVLRQVKDAFIGKDEIIDLLGICLIAKENAFLLGPPGTAKSAIVRKLSSFIQSGNNFEYLLTRFTEPNELFGPYDIKKLKEGELITNTEGMLPEASMVFLDEIFNANSAILNSLLMALNERIFRRGKETKKLPALMFIGASNILPEDESLGALLDRFLIRIKCDYVAPEALEQVLLAGWKLNHEINNPTEVTSINTDDILTLQSACKKVDLSQIRKDYIQLIYSMRNSGIKISDRRAVKMQNLIAASALICGRNEAMISDLWVLKHIWDSEDQIEILEGMIDIVIESNNIQKSHPQAYIKQAPNAEDLAKELEELNTKWDYAIDNLENQSLIKDQLRYLQNRASWVKQPQHQQYLQELIDGIWKKIITTV